MIGHYFFPRLLSETKKGRTTHLATNVSIFHFWEVLRLKRPCPRLMDWLTFLSYVYYRFLSTSNQDVHRGRKKSLEWGQCQQALTWWHLSPSSNLANVKKIWKYLTKEFLFVFPLLNIKKMTKEKCLVINGRYGGKRITLLSSPVCPLLVPQKSLFPFYDDGTCWSTPSGQVFTKRLDLYVKLSIGDPPTIQSRNPIEIGP